MLKTRLPPMVDKEAAWEEETKGRATANKWDSLVENVLEEYRRQPGRR